MTDLACPVAACPGRRRDTSMLMCWPCWRQVPRLLQRAVRDAFDAWRRHPSVESVAKLREEQNRAVKSVRGEASRVMQPNPKTKPVCHPVDINKLIEARQVLIDAERRDRLITQAVRQALRRMSIRPEIALGYMGNYDHGIMGRLFVRTVRQEYTILGLEL